MYVGICRGQKSMSDPMELELKAVVRDVIWVLGTKHGSPGKAVSVLNYQHICPPH